MTFDPVLKFNVYPTPSHAWYGEKKGVDNVRSCNLSLCGLCHKEEDVKCRYLLSIEVLSRGGSQNLWI